MSGTTTCKAINAHCWHATRAAFVKADAEIECLRLSPEGVVVRVTRHTIIVRVRAQKTTPHAQVLASKTHLCNGVVNRLHRQHSDREKPVRVGGTVVSKPTVIGPAHGPGELGVGHRP